MLATSLSVGYARATMKRTTALALVLGLSVGFATGLAAATTKGVRFGGPSVEEQVAAAVAAERQRCAGLLAFRAEALRRQAAESSEKAAGFRLYLELAGTDLRPRSFPDFTFPPRTRSYPDLVFGTRDPTEVRELDYVRRGIEAGARPPKR